MKPPLLQVLRVSTFFINGPESIIVQIKRSSEVNLAEFLQGVGVVVLREEFTTMPKLLRSTYSQIKGLLAEFKPYWVSKIIDYGVFQLSCISLDRSSGSGVLSPQS